MDCIGLVSLSFCPDDRGGQWELGYLFRPRAWGQGFATESCKAAIEILARDYANRQVIVRAAVDIANRRSLRVLAKLGFKFNEHKVFGGPKRFLGGDWRPHEILFFVKELRCPEIVAGETVMAGSVEVG